jgi:hypothetical protein
LILRFSPDAKSHPATEKLVTLINEAENNGFSDKIALFRGVQALCSLRAFSLRWRKQLNLMRMRV